jgi:hypothetical protein
MRAESGNFPLVLPVEHLSSLPHNGRDDRQRD